MKKVLNVVFASAIIAGGAFVGDAISSATDSSNPYAAQAQTARVRSTRRVGLTRRIYRGGKYVGTRVWDGTKWVGVKTWKGTKYVGRKTAQGTKYVGKKTWKTGRKVVSRSKKILY